MPSRLRLDHRPRRHHPHSQCRRKRKAPSIGLAREVLSTYIHRQTTNTRLSMQHHNPQGIPSARHCWAPRLAMIPFKGLVLATRGIIIKVRGRRHMLVRDKRSIYCCTLATLASSLRLGSHGSQMKNSCRADFPDSMPPRPDSRFYDAQPPRSPSLLTSTPFVRCCC